MHNLNEALSSFIVKAEWAGVPLVSGLYAYTHIYRSTLRKLAVAIKGVHRFIASEIRERRKKVRSGLISVPNDFIEHYLLELHGQGNKAEITEDWLHDLAVDFFVSGSETTATTLRWALVYMIRNTHVMHKVQNELDSVLGKPCALGVSVLADRARLPYTEATLMEVQRLASILPSALFHGTLSDVKIKEYSLPKGTQVSNMNDMRHTINTMQINYLAAVY